MLKNILNLDAIWPAQSQKAYQERFLKNKSEHLFFGSFDSFAAAEAAIPSNAPVGYDNVDAATKMYSHQVCEWDYPALFWIADAFAKGMTSVFDLGGHVGIKYYAFRRVVQYPPGLRWTVCDVKHVAQAGEKLAREQNVASELAFCTDFRQASGTDLLFISGCLQYLPTTMKDILQALEVPPKRIILNTTAVHASRTLYTLNSIGYGICPYRIQHHEEVFKDIRDAGYRRRDMWRNESKPIHVPFVEGGDAAYYLGCCFDRA